MKKALLVWGGWDGHEPKQSVEAAADILNAEGFETQITDTLDSYLDSENLNSLNLIVQSWTMGEISDEQTSGLLAAIKNGVGFAGWHGGTGDSFRNSFEFQFMVGGQFVAHPGNIIDFDVNITKPNDRIVAGIEDFKINSEQYYMHVDPGNEVLATTTFDGRHDSIDWIKGTVMPVIWTRNYGKGKVFYCSLGHVAKELELPQLREIIKRGMLWASK